MDHGRPPQLLTELVDGARIVAGELDGSSEALTDGDQRLTWAQYTDRVARLARVLVDLGVAPGDRVGIRMPKSCDSFVAVHAILRAGAVMVPLDALAPEAHTAAVIADAGLRVVIGDRRSQAIVAAAGVHRYVMPGVDAAEVSPPVERLALEAEIRAAEPLAAVERHPDDPAYVIYTSGSTGTPKGIVHTHRSALAYATAAVDEYGLLGDDRFANIAPLHFDQSTFELYAAPLVGGAVLVLPDPVLRFPASVSELVARERVTIWYSVPYLLEQLAARGALDERDLSSLRWVLFGGESFPPTTLAQLVGQLPSARWSNVYGPAEVNQCTVYHFGDAPDGPVPIGTAWPAARIVLVDPEEPQSLRSVDHDQGEPGAIGVIAVSTSTMMREYWNRPDLTEAAIVTDSEGDRWYLTGDLATRDERGRLMFLGRVDHQVKVRGHRIELEGVDAVLRELEAVSAATVVVDRSTDDARLVAFVVVDGAAGDADDWHATALAHLRSRLPRYAVPAELRVVADLPRTGTGKVDRQATSRILHEAIET